MVCAPSANFAPAIKGKQPPCLRELFVLGASNTKHGKIDMKQLMKVVAQGEPFAVQSQKAENGQVMKCNIVLQEVGGKYEDTYVAAMLGQLASCKFYAGELVYAVLRFQTREYNGQMFQDILAVELIKMKN